MHDLFHVHETSYAASKYLDFLRNDEKLKMFDLPQASQHIDKVLYTCTHTTFVLRFLKMVECSLHVVVGCCVGNRRLMCIRDTSAPLYNHCNVVGIAYSSVFCVAITYLSLRLHRCSEFQRLTLGRIHTPNALDSEHEIQTLKSNGLRKEYR